MKKLNLGCGLDYRKGWVNLDFNKKVKADVYANFEKKLPFEDDTFDYIYTHYVLEHVKDFFSVVDELYRISKPNAIIEIYVPHYTSIYNLKYPFHYQSFGIGSFICFTKESDNNQRYAKAKFFILKEELHFLPRGNRGILKIFKIFDLFFNISKKWQQIWERIFLFGFDEVYYKLRVIK